MSTRDRASVPVLEDLDQWREQHVRYKQKVASRRQFEDRFQSLAKQTFDAAFECHLSKDGDGIGEALTEALLPLTGFSFADRSPHERWEQLIHPDDLPVVITHIQRVLGGQRDVCVFRMITRSGTVRWFGALTRPVWDEGGRRVAYVYGLVHDHSALTDAELSPAGRDTGARGAVPTPLLCQHAIY